MPGGYPRGPQPVSGGQPPTVAPYPPGSYQPNGYAAQPAYQQPGYQPAYQQPGAAPGYGGPPTVTYQPPAGSLPPPLPALPPPPPEALPGMPITPAYPGFQPPSNIVPPGTPTPLDVFVEETRTGRFMFGLAVNSDAGVTGNITVDERNFDIAKPPGSWDDFANGTALRGAGQGFRIEAQPGNRVQRYLISFTDPYFINDISFNASAFYFDRIYFDWNESRYGGRLSWGYRLTPDLSVTAAARAENVNIFQPRVNTVPELNAVIGRSDIFSGRFGLMHDTRDIPFQPTQGHYVELAYEQVFGSFDYPRGDITAKQYFMVRQRPDGSGRHTVALSSTVGLSGAQTPIFENYFAGGYSTLRGFQFRGAGPHVNGVSVGGQFQWISAAEYFFPLTADDMIRGTVFCDFGTVEQDIAVRWENFRVAPGFGFRINVPAMGPAPLAFDFTFPVAQADGDIRQVFSFFMGATR
jgi:outer membrane protein insertion porin family